MEKLTNQPNFLPKMYCTVFGHNYKVTKKVTYHVKEYTCCHCKKELTTNSNGNLIELTPKFREINAILEKKVDDEIVRKALIQRVRKDIYADPSMGTLTLLEE